MNKDAKAMKYAIEPIRKILKTDACSDGGTQKKAEELEGTWIRLNEYECVMHEDAVVTRVYDDGTNIGCACDRFKDSDTLQCEHILAFRSLKSPPQKTIESHDYRWLRTYLLSKGWQAENRRLYPLDAETIEPENEDKPRDTGVGEKPEPTMFERKCSWCEFIERGADRDKVVAGIEEHRKTCPKNPANKKKPTAPKAAEQPHEAVVKESLTTDAKSATVEKPPKKEEKKVKPNTVVTKTDPKTPTVKKEMPTDAEFQSAKVGRLMKSQGSIYKVTGKEVADSAAVSSYAVSAGVSTETTVLEQTKEYARATVRAHKGGRYTEGSVLIRRDAIIEKLIIDLAEKNPSWIVGWSNSLPEFDLNQKVFIGDTSKILGLHIAGVVADKWMFASRDCETKAGRRAQIKILGADWREDGEAESEVEEMKTVAKRR